MDGGTVRASLLQIDVKPDETVEIRRKRVAGLVRAAPPNLSVVPLGIDEEGVHLRARFLGGPPASDSGSSGGGRRFDTR